jgi:tRNA-2-methylthio-N6-dimethylallyladenosine synthase
MYLDLMAPKKQAEINSQDPNAIGVFIETYGCQMNVADSEIVASIMTSEGYFVTDKIEDALVIFLNTCSVRDNAEKTILNRLTHLRQYKKKKRKLIVGILGCMAERLKDKLIGERDLVQIVVGPDEYRSVPSLVEQAMNGTAGIAVKLSKVETYEDIAPLRTEGLSAWLSIMRGCNNFCAFCVVPYTRGRERSRSLNSVVEEVKMLAAQGIKEITLLGQNVNSYNDKEIKNNNKKFPELLAKCAEAAPNVRIRYSTSHPHDMSDELIYAHRDFANICNYIHLPVQSGSNRVLKKMRRDYTVEAYLERIKMIRREIPSVSISTDIIAGFCTETEDDHQQTLDLMAKVQYDGAYMYKYSVRENTLAYKYPDDVSEEIKSRRLTEIITQQRQISLELNAEEVGVTHQILLEGVSKKSDEQWQGRTDTNKVCIVDYRDGMNVGDKIFVRIHKAGSATLFGNIVD